MNFSNKDINVLVEIQINKEIAVRYIEVGRNKVTYEICLIRFASFSEMFFCYIRNKEKAIKCYNRKRYFIQSFKENIWR